MRRVHVVGLCVLIMAVYMLGGTPIVAAAMLPQTQRGSAPEQLSCLESKRLQVTLGLPPEYEMPDPYDGTGAPSTLSQLCVSVTTGNAYELLSWLENGSLQAAVLPSFAVQVLRADNPARFKREYLDFAPSPLALLPLKQRTITLTQGAAPARASDLRQFFDALKGPSPAATIVLPHHLSPAVPLLFTRAAQWAQERKLSGVDREAFFKALLEAMQFRVLPPAIPSPDGTSTLELAESVARTGSDVAPLAHAGELLQVADSDRLVVRRQVLLSLPELRTRRTALPAPAAEAERAAGLFAPTREDETKLSTALVAFRTANYGRFEQGRIARRYFRFTIAELLTLLQAHDTFDASTQGIALVLTGGGVKAAYQTRLIDHLYGSGRLRNDGPAGTSAVSAQVDYVIGTSGGALLGIFVSALNSTLVRQLTAADTLNLTEILWGAPGAYLRSQDVFPLVDMLRYASVVACFLMLLLASALALRFFEGQYAHIAKMPLHEPRFVVRRARGLMESWPWILVLGLAPVVIVKVSSVNGLEHMPVETGVVYMLMVLIALYADVRLTPHRPFTWRKVRVPTSSAGLAIVGLMAVVVALYGSQLVRNVPGFGAGQLGLVIVCGVGFVLLTAALYVLCARQSDCFHLEPRWPIARAALVVAAIVVLSYLGLALAVWLQRASFLEVTVSFWVWLLGMAFVLSCVLLYLGRSASPREPQLTWLQSTVAFLFSEPPARALWTSRRRYTRFMTLATMTWLWWNLLAAPGLYGNHNAQVYFQRTFATFATVAGQSQDILPLTVPFVVTATALEKVQERYFLFVNHSEEAATSPLSDTAWFNIVSDPRWIVARNAEGDELRSVAFASGSPFPVFSSHAVQLPTLKTPERLIDGGFAHNKPLEAARALGARKVLVLNSTPLETAPSVSDCVLYSWLKLGELACNLPKLIPYLWERSQVEDILSSESMLVASIYPTAVDGDWPLLVDFRSAVIKRLRQAADADTTRRIGVMERWGVPYFVKTQSFLYNVESVRQALREQ